MYIWIHDKYSSTSFERRLSCLWQTEKWFWYNKTNYGVTVVQWPRSCLHVQINRVRLPATLFSVSLCRFFFLFSLCFLILSFPFGLFSFFLTADPAEHALWINIYFTLKSGVLFWKRDFKSSWSVYWPSLRPKKPISSQHMSLLWNSLIFFSVSWRHDKQHTVHHKLY